MRKSGVTDSCDFLSWSPCFPAVVQWWLILPCDQHPVPNVNSFDEACFPDEMMALLRERFQEPSPIQKQIWPAMRRNIVGAETGAMPQQRS
ncbi:unnamed protein product, partial [Cladocopium goreaui]